MRVALVVQRYGKEVLGGSESLARQYAECLRDACDVEVLTTCARDHISWRNHFPAGAGELNGVRVRRFPTDFARDLTWFRLWRTLLGRLDQNAFPGDPLRKMAHARRMAGLPRALQEEAIRRQGPYSSALFDYLTRHGRDYDAFVFFTYLYPTTYFGVGCVPADRAVVCPTLHDEPTAYLPAFRRVFERSRFAVYLSEAERRLAGRLHGASGPSEVVGMAITAAAAPRLPRGAPRNYVLYAGRIEEMKGIGTLLECFLAYKRRHPSDLKLVLIGSKNYPLPRHRDLAYLGFVGEAEKLGLMHGARAFLHPSPFESFSIVLLESFLMGTPALVTAHNEVLEEHCARSGAGRSFEAVDDFCERLEELLTDEEGRRDMGARGRRYVEENFPPELVRAKLLRALTGEGGTEERPNEYRISNKEL